MRKAFGYPELAPVFGRKYFANPLAEGFGAFSEVDRDIEDLALCDAHEFALGLLNLVVQATQDVFGGATVVVLHEIYVAADKVSKLLAVKIFKKEAPLISEHLGFDDEHVGDGGWVGSHFSLSAVLWPSKERIGPIANSLDGMVKLLEPA